jgi:phospho-N-acetylmuramoyl-pentapeptide-transferase
MNILFSFSNPNIFLLKALGSILTAFSLLLLSGPLVIRKLQLLQYSFSVRADVPKRHLSKTGTPSLGGLWIITVMLITSVFWNNFAYSVVQILLASLIGFGGIGFLDDYLKLSKKGKGGLSVRQKYGLQTLLALTILISLSIKGYLPTHIQFGQFVIGLGIWAWLWTYFIIVASSNAMNLTDGLDGLASSQTIIIAMGLLLSLLKHNGSFITPDLQEVFILAGNIIGATFGFLWFNWHPAKLFMGDVGSLALGAMLSIIAIIIHQEIAFACMAIIPVIETLSVILQVAYFKKTRKRLFRMAPFHHHLELKGWSEPKIVISLSLYACFFTLLALYVFVP